MKISRTYQNMLLLIAKVLILLSLLLGHAYSICDNMDCSNGLNINCYEFDSWNEVNEDLGSLTCQNNLRNILFQPKAKVLLNSQFNMTSYRKFGLIFYGLSGVNVYPWPAFSNYNGFKIRLFLYFSKIEFYVNNTLPNAYTCSPDLVPDDSTTSAR
jgi:hypothetical protein